MPTHTVMFVDVDTGTSLQGLFLAAGREPTSQFQKHDRYVSYKRLEINSNHDGFFLIFLVETLVFRDCPFEVDKNVAIGLPKLQWVSLDSCSLCQTESNFLPGFSVVRMPRPTRHSIRLFDLRMVS